MSSLIVVIKPQISIFSDNFLFLVNNLESSTMILFTISTNIKSKHSDLADFISEAFLDIAKNIEEKPEVCISSLEYLVFNINFYIFFYLYMQHVGLVIHRTTKSGDTEPDRTDCEITHFKEKLSAETEENLRKAAIAFSSLFNKWLDVKKHEFVITVLSYKVHSISI